MMHVMICCVDIFSSVFLCSNNITIKKREKKRDDITRLLK